MFYDPLGDQIEHPVQEIAIGKRWFVFCNLPELPVQTFADVCCVYDLPNLRQIFKERAQNFPVFLPAFRLEQVLDAIETTDDAFAYFYDTQTGETVFLADPGIMDEANEGLEELIENSGENFSGFLRNTISMNTASW